jgi:hypothetical protein
MDAPNLWRMPGDFAPDTRKARNYSRLHPANSRHRMLELQPIENVQRIDVNELDEARLCRRAIAAPTLAPSKPLPIRSDAPEIRLRPIVAYAPYSGSAQEAF